MYTVYTAETAMLILLTDGSGLTSRQVATQAAAAGHRVEVVSPTRIGLAGFTRHVRRVHRVPAFGKDPDAWLAATVDVLKTGGHDVLLPTQEQAALLARDRDRIQVLGVALAVPPFAGLLRVQDKVAQAETLRALGLPHPPTTIARTAAELAEAAPAVYVKAPIGTASTAVRRFAPTAGEFPVVVQRAVPGPVAMVQAVYDHGRLVAWHANLREREGANGGAAAKRSIALPEAERDLERLGAELRWHGALSLDAIVTPDGPSYIDVNPRLVEPGNAWRAGTDLVSALIDVSTGSHPRRHARSRPGVRTRQRLLGVLAHSTRAGVLRELAHADDAAEELTPIAGDPLAAVPVLAAAAAMLVSPRAASLFTEGAVAAYALTPPAWAQILASAGTSR
jgi:predicted ATP-grasp superfamily ATP-dependent carboligase